MRAVANENINFIVRLYDELSHSLLLFLSSVFNKIYGNMSVFNCLRSYWFLMCHFKRIASFNSIIICISIYLHIRMKSKFRTFIYVDLFAYNLHNIKNGIEIGMLRKCVKWRPKKFSITEPFRMKLKFRVSWIKRRWSIIVWIKQSKHLYPAMVNIEKEHTENVDSHCRLYSSK